MSGVHRVLRVGLLYAPGVVSVTVSLLHVHTHDPNPLPAVWGQAIPLVVSVLFLAGSTVAANDVPADEQFRIGWFLAGAWALTGTAGLLYAAHQFVTPLVALPVAAALFEANFFATLGGSLGLAVGVGAVRRDRSLERYREQRDRFQLLFSNVQSPVAEYCRRDGEYVLTDANGAFRRLFEVELPISAAAFDDRVVPSDRREGARALPELLSDSDPTETEVFRRTRDGRRWFTVRTATTDGTHGFAIYTDITDRRLRTQQIEVLDRMLRHNLRNQMNVVDGYADLLETALEDEELAGYAERIGAVATSLTTTADTVRFVRDRLENDPPKPELVDVAAIVERALGRARDAHPEAVFEFDSVGASTAYAHDTLGIVLDAFFENAVKHSESETPQITVEMTHLDEEELAIRVGDDGPAIPESELLALESESEPTQLEHATGIDLWMANWFVTEFGGYTKVPENGPEGSVVSIRLRRGDLLEGDAGQSVAVSTDGAGLRR